MSESQYTQLMEFLFPSLDSVFGVLCAVGSVLIGLWTIKYVYDHISYMMHMRELDAWDTSWNAERQAAKMQSILEDSRLDRESRRSLD